MALSCSIPKASTVPGTQWVLKVVDCISVTQASRGWKKAQQSQHKFSKTFSLLILEPFGDLWEKQVLRPAAQTCKDLGVTGRSQRGQVEDLFLQDSR